MAKINASRYLRPSSATLGFVLLLAYVCVLAADKKMVEPRYDSNQLIRPEGYREWIFVGSNLGMSYSDDNKPRTPRFHNVYIQPEAYRHFSETGTFPDKTMLVMEVLSAGSRTSINRAGQFADEFLGIEVALKDEKRFEEKWAYFDFIGSGGKPLAQAKPFPKDRCWTCHNSHGAVDNVFVQFYPVLREARKKSDVR